MKKMIILVFLLTTNLMTGLAQDSTIPFQVNINYPPLSISLDQLYEANNITDLNRMYKDEWVREYLSVEITSLENGKESKITGANFHIDQEQKDFLKKIDFPARITVDINYIPENTLKNNTPREEKFTFTVHPTKSASFVGGDEKLQKYLYENAISKIPDTIFEGYDLAVVKFIINEQGQVVDTAIFQSTKDDNTDNLLYGVICDMPDWIPAQYTNGEKVRQEFAFTVGNHENCTINMLNTVNSVSNEELRITK